MKLLQSVFTLELKRRLRWVDIIIFSFILIIFIYFVNIGNARYSEVLENKDIFQKMENLKVKQFHNYTLYGYYGISIFFIPSPFSIYNADPGFDELLSNVNTGERLDILQHRKGKNYFIQGSGLINLKGMTLLFSIFFSLLYGWDLTRKKEYLRLLASFKRPWVLYMAMSFVRILMLVISAVIIICFSHLLLLFKNTNLFMYPLFYIILPVILVIGVFFFLGCVIGSFKSKALMGIAFGSVYFASIFLIPGIAYHHTRLNADDIESLYKFDLNNLELIMSVEKKALEKVGVYKDDGDVAPVEFIYIVKRALNKEFEMIYSRQDRMISQMLGKIRSRHVLSCFFPVLFYNTSLEELSSCGGLSFIDFYRYSKKRKKEFIDFYVEKKFLSKSKNKTGKTDKIESFVKTDENLFYASSHLPYAYGWGVFITLLYILGLAIIAYIRFKRVLNPYPEKESTGKIGIDLNPGQDNHFNSFDFAAAEHLYNLLSGQVKGFQGRVSIAGQSIVTGTKRDFIYACNPEEVPGEVTVNGLLGLFKNLVPLDKDQYLKLKSEIGPKTGKQLFSKLSPDDKVKVLFKLLVLKGSGIYLFRDFLDRCSSGCIRELSSEIKALKGNNALLIYFSDRAFGKPLKVDRYFVYGRSGRSYDCQEVTGGDKNG